MVKIRCGVALKSALACLLSLISIVVMSPLIFAVSGEITPVLTPQNTHSLFISDIQCSHDGAYVISTSKDGTSSLWEASTYNKLSVIGSDIYGAVFSPSGDLVNLCRTNFTSQFSINNMSLTDKNKLVIPALSKVKIIDNGQRIWDINQKRYLTTVDKTPVNILDATFYDSKQLVAYAFKGKVEIWNYQKNILIKSVEIPAAEYIQTRFNDDGTQIAVFCDNFEIVLLSGDNFSVKKTLQNKTSKNITPFTGFELYQTLTPVSRLAFTANGNILSINNIGGEIFLVSYTPNGAQNYCVPLNVYKITGQYFNSPNIIVAPDKCTAAVWSFSDYKLRIFNIITGEIITEIKISETIPGAVNYLASTVEFSQDSKKIFVGDMNGDITNWNIDGSYLGKFGREISGIFTLKYTADDSLTLVTDNAAVIRWDLITGRSISKPGINKKFQYPIKILPDGRMVSINQSIIIKDILNDKSSDYFLKGWKNNSRYSLFDSTSEYVGAILRDGKNGRYISAAYLDIAEGQLSINLIREHDVFPITVSAKSGKALLRNVYNKPALIVDLKTGFVSETNIPKVATAQFLDTGEILFADSEMNKVNNQVISFTSFGLADQKGKIIWKRVVNDISLADRIIHSKSYFAICDIGKNNISVFNINNGTFVNKFPCFSIKSAAITPDEKQLITTESANTVNVFQLSDGKLITNFNIMSVPTVVDFSPDSKFAAFGCSNGAVEIVSMFDWKRQALAMVDNYGGWSVVDEKGRYDAPNGDGNNLLRWTVAKESVALEQLKERYYDPALLSKAMDKNFEPKRDVQALDGVKLFPTMKVDFPVDGTELTINLTNQGGGIGDMVVIVNGRTMPVGARGNYDKNSKSLQTKVDLSQSPVFLPGVDNLIELAVKNADGTLSSSTLMKIWKAPGVKKENPPRLFALICGISEYSGGLKLKYAANDAVSMANAIKVAGNNFFGEENTNIITLTSSDKNNKPSRENILNALDLFKNKATTSDLIIVYLSGHGTALDNDDYCYLTVDARSVEDIRDKKLREKYSICSSDLQLLMGRISALKQVMILDTCAAGSAVKNLIEKRDISGDQIRAIERMRDRSGFHILMGCAADARSFEASQYGHGLLTYALLEGFKGAALREGKYIDTSKLFNYAAERVPQLARGIGGIQRPVIAVPRGISFDFGMLHDEDRANIKISTPLPVYIKPVFMDTLKTRDTLEISSVLQNTLKDKSDKLIYIDADSFPDSLAVKAVYTVENGIISAKIKIWKNENVVNEFTLQAKNAKEIVSLLMKKI